MHTNLELFSNLGFAAKYVRCTCLLKPNERRTGRERLGVRLHFLAILGGCYKRLPVLPQPAARKSSFRNDGWCCADRCSVRPWVRSFTYSRSY
ncbi:hypothetical protein CEXT_67551 [Caerostris extrusa]|uniref:Uncharacterized protein n=1 Tax=Caerostris extrusa TaxID=172846 RepID=A0AAV4XRT7_CAEEX|nr:hypothetical protein CEXT_67551 [Caerostris extrusa]